MTRNIETGLRELARSPHAQEAHVIDDALVEAWLDDDTMIFACGLVVENYGGAPDCFTEDWFFKADCEECKRRVMMRKLGEALSGKVAKA